MSNDTGFFQKLLKQFDIKEILKFLVGGGSAVLTDFLVYIFLINWIPVSAAKTISYISGATVGFFINKLWTFESKKFKIAEIIKYVILYCVSAATNTLMNKLVLIAFSSVIFAFLCATGVSTIINYLGQKFIVFKCYKSNE